MNQKQISHTRLTQFHAMQARLGSANLNESMDTRAPTQLRVLAWGFSKLVNVAMAVAGVFQKPTRGDLSLLEFELMSLGYFLPVKEIVGLDAEVVRLSDEQKSVLVEMHKAGLIDQPDEKHLLVMKYVDVVNEAEELVQRVHAAYREYVTFRNLRAAKRC